MIDEVIWAVQPGAKQNTRPSRLVNELITLGCISQAPRYFHHGRSPSMGGSTSLGAVRPTSPRPANAGSQALLTPATLVSSPQETRWADFYDDWAIAPGVSLPSKLISRRTYRQFANLERARTAPLITANSKFMAARLGLDYDKVVPNGVDIELGSLARSGNSDTRIVVLGHFFSGRTDFSLLEQVSCLRGIDEVVVGLPGKSREMRRVLSRIERQTRARVVAADWLSPQDLADLAGPKTFALIPHVVSDYTVSQDLMKIYQFLALGIRVACPALLVPPQLSGHEVFKIGPGAQLDSLNSWSSLPPLNDEWRREFASVNAWTRRAERIAEMLSRP